METNNKEEYFTPQILSGDDCMNCNNYESCHYETKGSGRICRNWRPQTYERVISALKKEFGYKDSCLISKESIDDRIKLIDKILQDNGMFTDGKYSIEAVYDSEKNIKVKSIDIRIFFNN